MSSFFLLAHDLQKGFLMEAFCFKATSRSNCFANLIYCNLYHIKKPWGWDSAISPNAGPWMPVCKLRLIHNWHLPTSPPMGVTENTLQDPYETYHQKSWTNQQPALDRTSHVVWEAAFQIGAGMSWATGRIQCKVHWWVWAGHCHWLGQDALNTPIIDILMGPSSLPNQTELKGMQDTGFEWKH